MGSEKKISTSNDISIVICTKDRHELLIKSVTRLRSIVSEDKYLEIVIIEETDNPQRINGAKVKYYTIPERGRGLGFTRNTGLRKAHGSIIVFIDDDVLPAEDWFENLLEPFRDKRVGAVGGAVLPDLSQINAVGKCVSFLGFPAGGLKRYLGTRERNYETDLISTGNCAFRAALGRSAGGFDELLRNGEDTEFFSRISKISSTIFVPQAIVFHKQRNTLIGVFRWFIKRGRGRFLKACKKGTHPVIATIIPLRGNFLIKLFIFILAALILLSFSPLVSLAFAISAYIVWNTVLWKREHHLHSRSPDGFDEGITRIKNTITTRDVMILLPLVKLCMDIGREVGKLMALCRYIKQRIFAKPLVLTFHRIGTPEIGNNSPNPKYTCSKASLQQILRDSEIDGWVVVSLVELLKRLKESSRTLYFEKILAITFDDAYASIFEPLSEICDSGDGPFPFTIFVPTALVGKTNQWEQSSAPGLEEILSWNQLEGLRTKGAEVGSHTCNHVDLRTSETTLRKREIVESLKDLRSNLSDRGGNEIILSYPYGAYDQDVVQIVKEAGYIGAVANYKGNIRPATDPYQIPRFTVFTGSNWRSIARQSHSMWAKDLLRDIRDWTFLSRRKNGHGHSQ